MIVKKMEALSKLRKTNLLNLIKWNRSIYRKYIFLAALELSSNSNELNDFNNDAKYTEKITTNVGILIY